MTVKPRGNKGWKMNLDFKDVTTVFSNSVDVRQAAARKSVVKDNNIVVETTYIWIVQILCNNMQLILNYLTFQSDKAENF